MNDFTINADSLSALQKKVEKLTRRAARLNVQPITLDVLETVQLPQKVETLAGREVEVTVEKIRVRLSGDAPVLAGYTFLAAIDHAESADENIVDIAPGVDENTLDLAALRIAPSTCEHCGRIRSRNKTFLLETPEGQHIRVGRTCLSSFVGCDDATQYAAFLEWYSNAETACQTVEDSDRESQGRGKAETLLLDVVEMSARVIREYGFTSKSNASTTGSISTASIVCHILSGRARREDALQVDDCDVQLASKAIAWFRGRTDKETNKSNYIHTLRTLCRQSFVADNRIAFIVSLIPAYRGAIEQEHEKKAESRKSNQHLGVVGNRSTFENITVAGVREIDGNFGCVTVIRFEDATGNLLVWFASNPPRDLLDIGATATVAATVKKHDEYNGRKQTVITRAKVTAIRNAA